MMTPHNTPNTNTKAPGVSPASGHERSVPEQMHAGQLVATGHTRLGAQLELGHKGQLGVAQIARAVDTPLVSSGTAFNRCANIEQQSN